MPSLPRFTYKLHKPFIHFAACLFFLAAAITAFSQHKKQNPYGLKIINNIQEMRQAINSNDSLKMMDLQSMVPSLVLDLKYRGTDNFMKQRLYPKNTTATFLRLPAANALAAVQEKLKEKNLGLKIWDAYRPYSVTQKMWEPVKDDRYAADPKFGSGHNRGVAVDLTLINLQTGAELEMGTGFDHFSDTAHANFKKLPPAILANRELLRSTMHAAGFKVLDTEWWHFYLPDAKRYDLLDLNFRDLKKLSRE